MSNDDNDGVIKSFPQSKQSEVFLESEGDSWFIRNDSASYPKKNIACETIKRVLSGQVESIQNILEIGSSSGERLWDLCSHFKARGLGIDPSARAIYEGGQRFKDLNFSVAIASDLPAKDCEFDLVFFGFCLYLVDRADIFKAVSEADRVLRQGGFLAILDFDHSHPQKRPYHHLPGLFTFKNTYSDFFTSGGHYHLIAKESFSHKENYFSEDPNERVSIEILYKEINPYASF